MSWKINCFATAGVLGLMSLPIMAVDYFADGCMVDYDHVYTVQVRPGVFVSEQGVMCHQAIIHTARGKEREGDHR